MWAHVDTSAALGHVEVKHSLAVRPHALGNHIVGPQVGHCRIVASSRLQLRLKVVIVGAAGRHAKGVFPALHMQYRDRKGTHIGSDGESGNGKGERNISNRNSCSCYCCLNIREMLWLGFRDETEKAWIVSRWRLRLHGNIHENAQCQSRENEKSSDRQVS